MPRVLMRDGKDIRIGAYQFPDKKKPALCVQRGNRVVVYGYFTDEARANAFINELGELVGAVFEDEKEVGHDSPKN